MAASRRCVGAMTRQCRFLFASSNLLEGFSIANHHPSLSILGNPSSNPPPDDPHFRQCFQPVDTRNLRHFSSRATGASGGEEEEDEIDEVGADTSEEESGDEEKNNYEEDEEDEEGEVLAPKRLVQSGKSAEEKAAEAAAIGYKVIGPLDPSERPFKPWEPVFAVVQIGSHQFKVSNGDSIFTERLKFCDVNDKLILTKVLMLGSRTQTIIGRPILSDATVHAVVEEHALDAKVIIFKKKRRKNYRRTKGHRQELTKLRITDIQGIEKPTKVAVAA